MDFEVRPWNACDPAEIEKCFLDCPAKPFSGTPLAGPVLMGHLFRKAQRQAELCPDRAFALCHKGAVKVVAQVEELYYLREWFDLPCAGIVHVAFRDRFEMGLADGIIRLIKAIKEHCVGAGIVFMTLNVPADALSMIRALEHEGFRYAEGYLQMVSDTRTPCEAFQVPGLIVRDAVPRDLKSIEHVYREVRWPTHLTTEPGFDPDQAFMLYFEQMRKIFANVGDRVRLMIGELDGAFAAAQIALVDEELYADTGILTNPRHGMALVVHPRFQRRGVSMHMVADRQRWYRDLGVEWVDFTPNFNNFGMIRSLEKMGFRYGSVRMTLHKWLAPRPML